MPTAVGSVAFLGNYLPRRCGIATFTHDIHRAVADRYPATRCQVCAVTDPGQSYDYPDDVCFEIEEQEPASYLRAADSLNLRGTDVLCIQHEYGIYGGASGSYVQDIARKVHAPIVTTLHTVLERPSPQQNTVLRDLISLSARVVVMSARAREILSSTYGAPPEMIDLIPHGIPDMPFVDSSFYKEKLGVEGKFVLLTFGLLSVNKGIENVIEALPEILNDFPNVVYLVVGATHPHVIRSEGEAYRGRLERRVKELGLEHAVLFTDRFVEIEELKEFIAVADMYITPYLNPAQIISGTLAYSFGCGKAVISTPYLHALELLAEGRGIIVPFADPHAISQAVLGLLRDDSRRHSMRRKAYLMGREMTWREVAGRYMESFDRARRSRYTSRSHSLRAAEAMGNGLTLPSICFDHLHRMTDATGLIQHARFALPHYPEGYCSDDNARALAYMIRSSKPRVPSSEKSSRHSELTTWKTDLTATYASFLNAAFNPATGKFRNFMDYNRQWLDEAGSDDCQGRCVMALGICIAGTSDADLRRWAADLFHKAAPAIRDTGSPRGWASALLGIDAYLGALRGDREMSVLADQLECRLVACFNGAKSSGWPWFEEILSYDNALLSHALIARGRENRRLLAIGLRSLRWLITQQTAPEGHFRPIGSEGFYPRGGERSMFDQQPLEASGMVAASLAAYRATGNDLWVEQAQSAFHWLLGANDLGLTLYDHRTGGCCDGLHIDRVNRNQGAESTLAYLDARREMDVLQDVLKKRSGTVTSLVRGGQAETEAVVSGTRSAVVASSSAAA